MLDRISGKTTVIILATTLVVLLSGSEVHPFDLPNYDPWYYQCSEQGYAFTVPDKAQHFYGSAMLNEFNKRLPLPGIDVMGPVLSFAAGFMYEAWQDQRGAGFSQRDLFSDAMGVAASQLSSENVVIWLDYSAREQALVFNVTLRFGG